MYKKFLLSNRIYNLGLNHTQIDSNPYKMTDKDNMNFVNPVRKLIEACRGTSFFKILK